MSTKSSGFTLVELAIVMIIIGLLIGGILKGQELIFGARLKTTMSNINAYRAAVITFEDTYKGTPGDISDAGNRIPGCAVHPNCVAAGGNGNSIIGTPNIANWSRDDQSGLATEATQFWLHLALADLISGVAGGNTQTWGDTYPSSPLGGGYQVFHANETGDNQARGHYFMLRLRPTGDPHPTAVGTTVLTPAVLSRLGRQFDDNIPNTGYIIADDAGSACWNTGTRTYVAASNDNICLAAFKF